MTKRANDLYALYEVETTKVKFTVNARSFDDAARQAMEEYLCPARSILSVTRTRVIGE